MPSVDHVILTRFNLPSAGPESLVRAQDDWLADRVVLCERYCLPSVRDQRAENFSWIIYFDPESPTWLRDWIDKAREFYPFHPIYRTAVSRQELVSDIRDVVEPSGDMLVTTNLDNDDSLGRDFLSRIQGAVTSDERKAVYIKNGLIRSGERLYRHSYRHNPFASVAEPWSNPVTAWADWHTRLGKHMSVDVLPGSPGWLQVIHGKNVSNRVHGVLTNPERHERNFGEGVSDLPEPSMRDLTRERFITAPARTTALTARTGAKNVVLGTIGPKRFDRLKLRLANLRRS